MTFGRNLKCWSALSVFLAANATLGCSTWIAQGIQPATVVEQAQPSKLRVTKVDSSVIELKNPLVTADSLKGTVNGVPASVALSDVAYVSLRRSNKLPIILAVSLGTVGGFLILLAATWN